MEEEEKQFQRLTILAFPRSSLVSAIMIKITGETPEVRSDIRQPREKKKEKGEKKERKR